MELRSTCGALEAAVNGSARSAPESHRADTRGRAQVDLLRGVAPTGASFDHVAAVLTALRCDHGHDHDTLSTSSLGLTVEASTKSPDEPTSASRAVHEPSKTMEARRQHETTCGLAAGPARAARVDEKTLRRLLIPKSGPLLWLSRVGSARAAASNRWCGTAPARWGFLINQLGRS